MTGALKGLSLCPKNGAVAEAAEQRCPQCRRLPETALGTSWEGLVLAGDGEQQMTQTGTSPFTELLGARLLPRPRHNSSGRNLLAPISQSRKQPREGRPWGAQAWLLQGCGSLRPEPGPRATGPGADAGQGPRAESGCAGGFPFPQGG